MCKKVPVHMNNLINRAQAHKITNLDAAVDEGVLGEKSGFA